MMGARVKRPLREKDRWPPRRSDLAQSPQTPIAALRLVSRDGSGGLWEIALEGTRTITLPAAEIWTHRRFQRHALEKLHVVLGRATRVWWNYQLLMAYLHTIKADAGWLYDPAENAGEGEA